MKKILTTTFAICCLSLMSSCGFIAHDVTIKPDLPVQPATIGQDKTMIVKVNDRRAREIIGHRTYMKTGNITLDKMQNIVSTIKKAIETGFQTLGFSVIQSGTADKNVIVNIELLSYEGLWGFFTVGSLTTSTFRVTCTTPSGKSFENIYRVEHENRYLFLPIASDNERKINKVLSEALMRIFQDNSFREFLKES